jgi:hypothetical protein
MNYSLLIIGDSKVDGDGGEVDGDDGEVDGDGGEARGGRRLRTVDLDLIQRPASPRTASGAPAADGRAPMVS